MTSHVEKAGINEAKRDEIIAKYWLRRPFSEHRTWLGQWNNPGVEVNRYVPAYIEI